jgi:thiosulfate dehydrogenase
MRTTTRRLAAAALAALTGCRGDAPARSGATGATAAAPNASTDRPPATEVHAAAFDPAAWRPPADSEIPRDSLGASIRRGLALLLDTPDSLPRFAPGRIACRNCHLDGGRNVDAAPLAGSHARFPKYMERTGASITLADRVNYCFTRSLAGRLLPVESREMSDILAYLAFISRGVPVGAKTPGAGGLVAMKDTLVGDTTRGAALFKAQCAACHGADGQGNPAIAPKIPALWGPRSYSVGASMAREERAASFIWHNMPLGRGKTLTPQQAFDVAAYVNGHARPDSPGKELDWPAGGAPADVPYDTRSGHKAHRAPPLLPRAHPQDAVVPPPARAAPLR